MLAQWFYQLACLAALSWRVAAEDKDGIKSIPVSNVFAMKLTNSFEDHADCIVSYGRIV
jgi:hypothetical protein